MDAPKKQKQAPMVKTQPWKGFFQVSQDRASVENTQSGSSVIRVVQEKDDKDLGG
jgi:hypothetical protein